MQSQKALIKAEEFLSTPPCRRRPSLLYLSLIYEKISLKT